MSGRTLAVGDIHGCDVALDVLLSNLALTAGDRLVVLGDVVDRGPNTRGALDRLLEARRACELTYVRGNHEEMMLDARRGGPRWRAWWENGGPETLRSYGGAIEDVPDAHWELIESAAPYAETGSEIFVHANLDPGVALPEQGGEWLRWRHVTGREPPHPSGRRVVCGHTAMRGGVPGVWDGWVCLETRVWRGSFLTCLDVGTDVIYQARQSGEYRYGVTLRDLI